MIDAPGLAQYNIVCGSDEDDPDLWWSQRSFWTAILFFPPTRLILFSFSPRSPHAGFLVHILSHHLCLSSCSFSFFLLLFLGSDVVTPCGSFYLPHLSCLDVSLLCPLASPSVFPPPMVNLVQLPSPSFPVVVAACASSFFCAPVSCYYHRP